jgi:hypothetical protein
MTSPNENIHDIVDLLDEEYYSLGVQSGHDAIATLLDDFFSGKLDEFLVEQESSKHEFHKTIFWVLAKKWISEGKMWQAQDKWYELQREYR